MFFTIIIPAPSSNPYLLECLKHISGMNFRNYEIIILLDKNNLQVNNPQLKIIETGKIGPAEKRDLGAKEAKGEVLAFIDDDAYPSEGWLASADKYFEDKNIASVCGPGVTPPEDNLLQKVSGLVNSSPIGSGPYAYRFIPGKKREVDDYPSMNILVRKSDFEKIGGFDTNYWPGEDTKLCLDLTQKLHKKIIYDPKVLVYHHRRPVFKKHLQQNGRYGLHRGFFAKELPATSFRISYFLPPLFTLGFITGPFFIFINKNLFILYLLIISIYFIIIFSESIKVFLKERNLSISLLFIPAIISTHIWYGIQFIRGYLFTKKLIR